MDEISEKNGRDIAKALTKYREYQVRQETCTMTSP
jgi:hypothetical protein